MSLLLLGRASDTLALLDPPDRPRAWFQLLFSKVEPRKRDMTPEYAVQVIDLNWERNYKTIKAEGALLPPED